jgi:hypothetical protein
MHTVAVCLVFHAIGMRKVAGYAVLVDIAVTVAFSLLYHGTYTGTSVGIFAGLFMSVYLHWYKKNHGYMRLERDGWKLAWFFYHNNPKYKDEYPRVKWGS